VGGVTAVGPHRPGFAVIDVETTGFSPEDERIIEVGVVLLGPDGVETGSFSTLIDPGCDPGPTSVHRITPSMLDGAPTFATVRPYLAETVSGRVLVGHNLDEFDLPFLRVECARAGGPPLVPTALATVDTLAVAQSHLELPGKARLVDCCDHYGLTWDDHHSALGDARVTAALFRAMRAELGDDVLDLAARLDAAAATSWPGGSPEVPTVRIRRPGRILVADGAVRARSGRGVALSPGPSGRQGAAQPDGSPSPSQADVPAPVPAVRRFGRALARRWSRLWHRR
jgi:DNA polymerase-3 subunit epsilon